MVIHEGGWEIYIMEAIMEDVMEARMEAGMEAILVRTALCGTLEPSPTTNSPVPEGSNDTSSPTVLSVFFHAIRPLGQIPQTEGKWRHERRVNGGYLEAN